jgi:hypothetical protein
MLKGRSTVAVLLALGLVLGGSSLAFTQDKPARPGGGGRGERHPQIHMAMRGLNMAAQHLEHAEHDFGGHRAKALQLVKQAETELKDALEWAKAHPEPMGKPGAAGAPAPKTQ